jgi:MerR family transcriptional regulator, redox-sensitive transcriptional activator SoxR
MAQVHSAAREITVGQLAARSGATVSALHFYEARGLISAHRTAGNQRRYPRAMLRRVAFIRASQRVGIPLARIKAALDTLPERRTPTARDWARLSAAWCRDLDERISALQDLRDRLTGCIGCGCLSLTDCQLANPDDTLGAAGAGPRRLSEKPEKPETPEKPGKSSGQPGHGQGGGQQDDGP